MKPSVHSILRLLMPATAHGWQGLAVTGTVTAGSNCPALLGGSAGDTDSDFVSLSLGCL